MLHRHYNVLTEYVFFILPFVNLDNIKYSLTVSKCILKDLLTSIRIVPALDPVPAKCTISSLIKDLLILIGIENA